VNQAITQMDQVTQQNAALVEQAAAAAESMKDQAGTLAQAVSTFVTEQPAMRGTRPAPARPVIAAVAGVAKKPARIVPSKAPAWPSQNAAKPALAKVRVASGAGAEDEWEEF
jgi:methyl-accepting chemotaxis protein